MRGGTQRTRAAAGGTVLISCFRCRAILRNITFAWDENVDVDVTSIIILNWNGLRVLGPCLAAIAENTLGDDYEVIVLDNGSEEPELRTRSNCIEGAAHQGSCQSWLFAR